ncbi:uncharacterized protein MYCFIDRAFT_169369 [Pseudocercospora fijiensis CIRAD86]|uniref:Uncharacterized protein n=1 Tax=Pseudocercospora fijiensis (strain CIRAD86) TaxID=383855 RepID=N1Q601_PSEFD|nr:uncharacterized protein MYCFIDRAFT_169369 [Pseudocercospora fijiensis CIRAD86]EME87560.1 hypothetical protein MYCFIDRAFT_169369 [Pseudocercospora fijiensis CIRAD86]
MATQSSWKADGSIEGHPILRVRLAGRMGSSLSVSTFQALRSLSASPYFQPDLLLPLVCRPIRCAASLGTRTFSGSSRFDVSLSGTNWGKHIAESWLQFYPHLPWISCLPPGFQDAGIGSLTDAKPCRTFDVIVLQKEMRLVYSPVDVAHRTGSLPHRPTRCKKSESEAERFGQLPTHSLSPRSLENLKFLYFQDECFKINHLNLTNKNNHHILPDLASSSYSTGAVSVHHTTDSAEFRLGCQASAGAPYAVCSLLGRVLARRNGPDDGHDHQLLGFWSCSRRGFKRVKATNGRSRSRDQPCA